MAKVVYVVEGNVGAGKSSAGERLAQTGKLAFLPEPVDEWREGFDENMLDLLYTGAERWTYAFQTCAFVTRAVSLSELLAHTDHDCILTERSVQTDRHVFAEYGYQCGNMTKSEYQIYQALWDLMPAGPRPRVTFYLRTPAEICLERIKERGRPEERGVDLAFLGAIEKLHDDWLVDQRDGPVVVLDGRRSVDALAAEILSVIDEPR